MPATLGKDAYKTGADVATIAVPNLLIVSEKMPDALAEDLTEVLFTYQPELAKVHPEGKNINKDVADETAPVALHPGAQKHLAG